MGISTASKDDALVVLKIVYWQRAVKGKERQDDKYVKIFKQPTKPLLDAYFNRQVIRNMFRMYI